MDLALAHSPALLALAALLAAALTWWTYGRSTPRPTGGLRVLLTGLRFAALFVVLLLLFEPIARRIEARDEPPVMAVLVDTSESLTAPTEGGAVPAERLRAALATLPADARFRVYTFAADAAPLARLTPESLRFDGARTDIARALARAEADLAGRNLRGVLLLSDGRATAGRNPAYLADRYRVPIYPAVVGDSVAQRDVRVERIVTNEVAYLGAALPVRVAVRATGYAGERAAVSLSDDGRTVTTGTVTLPADGLEATLDLAFEPAAPGLRRLAATVSPLAGEATRRNNTDAVTVRVLDTRRRVLLLGAAPGPDLSALREFFEADRRLELVPRTQRAPGQFYEGPLPDDLAAVDLVVLAGYPGRAADPAVATRVADAAERGVALLFVLTRQTDLAALGRQFGEVLPAVPAVVRPGFAEAGLVPTPAGSAHPVLTVAGTTPALLGALPPLEASESRWSVAPGARVLATQRRGGVPLEDPLVVVQARGAARTAAFLGAGLWRWRTLPAELDAVAGVFPALVGNLARWTTTDADRRRVRVRPAQAAYGEGEQVVLLGQVYDESLQPLDDAEVRVTLRGPAGTPTAGTMTAAGTGRYTLAAGVLPPGRYTFAAEASRDGQAIGTDAGAFDVGALALEFREPGADAALLRQVATRSGGRVIPLDSIGVLPAQLEAEGRLRPRRVERAAETPLIAWPWLLGLVVALLTAEWVLRKRSGLV